MANPTRTDSNCLISSVTRRDFLFGSAAISLAAALGGSGLLAEANPKFDSKRILVGSGTPDGILSFAWDSATGTLKPEGIAATVSHSTWLDVSPDRRFLYVACELD